MLCCLTAEAKVSTHLSSQNLVKGERCFIVYIIDTKSGELPSQPEILIPVAKIKLESANVIARQNKRYYRLVYSFRSEKAGTFEIPATTFSSDVENDTSESITFTVRDLISLQRQEVQSTTINHTNDSNKPRKTYPCYTQLVAAKSSLFPNEATTLEYKIYLPRSISVAQWGLPTGEKENATAWRFETPDQNQLNSSVIIDGVIYQASRFQTTVSGIKPGRAMIGPFKNRVVHNAPIITARGMMRETQQMHLVSNSIELDILNLPPNPPANFRGDVGQFTMHVDIQSKSEISSSESISARVMISGKGKFSELSAPILTDEQHWKLISETKRDMGERRKIITGFTEFDYLIQPRNTGPPTHTPGFSFSYLDPNLKTYSTINTPGVPITVNLTSNEAKSNLGAASNNNQILGIIEEMSSVNKPWYKKLPISLIHIIPACICLILLGLLAKRKYIAHRMTQSHKIIQKRSLQDLQNQDNEQFLKTASNYIQRWVDTDKHSEIKDILQFRDNHCYKPDSPVKLSEKRKQSIIDSLKKLIILFLCFSPQLIEASSSSLAVKHYQDEKFERALTEYKSAYESQLPDISADLLYNIGNCHQKLEEPAQAAILYHRALRLAPYHDRAQHNLSIIQNQYNSRIKAPFLNQDSLEYWISILSRPTYYVLTSLLIWFIVITILWIYVFRPHNKRMVILTSLSLIALCTAALSYYAYTNHPNKDVIPDIHFAIIAEPSDLLEQPIEGSQSLTMINMASECRILTTRGTYSYIKLADNINGWVKTSSLLRLIEKP